MTLAMRAYASARMALTSSAATTRSRDSLCVGTDGNWASIATPFCEPPPVSMTLPSRRNRARGCRLRAGSDVKGRTGVRSDECVMAAWSASMATSEPRVEHGGVVLAGGRAVDDALARSYGGVTATEWFRSVVPRNVSRKMLKISIIATLVAIAAPGVARADTAPTAADIGTLYAPAATVYWGKAPDCPNGITWTDLPTDPTAEVLGLAVPPCSVALRAGNLGYGSFGCLVVLHELGHLLGLKHGEPASVDPEGVMAEYQPTDWHAPVICQPHSVERRKGWRASDRRWCRRHQTKCRAKYPRLYQRAMPATIG